MVGKDFVEREGLQRGEAEAGVVAEAGRLLAVGAEAVGGREGYRAEVELIVAFVVLRTETCVVHRQRCLKEVGTV